MDGNAKLRRFPQGGRMVDKVVLVGGATRMPCVQVSRPHEWLSFFSTPAPPRPAPRVALVSPVGLWRQPSSLYVASTQQSRAPSSC